MATNCLTKAQLVAMKGHNIKIQHFSTEKGAYTIFIKEYCDELYFYKTLDGELVECVNLSEAMVHE